METLKLVGIGHKVLLVRDDIVKLVDLGSIFSSGPKKEYLFSVRDITNVEVKKPSLFSSGSIRIKGNQIVPSLKNEVCVLFSGEENYKIATAMEIHITSLSDKNDLYMSNQQPEDDNPTIHIPPQLEGKLRTYRCPCVPVSNLQFDVCLESAQKQEWTVHAKEIDGRCVLYSRGLEIGEIGNDNIAEMVLDWIHRGEPYLIFLYEVYPEEREANITIAFYLDRRGSLSNYEYDIVKLTACLSNEKQELIPYITEGEELGIHEEYDYGTGKSYVGVFWDETEIGHLPSKYVSHFSEDGMRGCFFEKCETNDNLKNIPYVRIYW